MNALAAIPSGSAPDLPGTALPGGLVGLSAGEAYQRLRDG